jgi:hypothetical protein
MDTYCTSCRMDTAGQHESSCSLYEDVVVVGHPRPTLWLQPCYGCKEKDAELAQKDATLAALTQALREYGKHPMGCPAEFGEPYKCKCGWDDTARALLAPTAEGT